MQNIFGEWALVFHFYKIFCLSSVNPPRCGLKERTKERKKEKNKPPNCMMPVQFRHCTASRLNFPGPVGANRVRPYKWIWLFRRT